jgi:hypothetical protein
MIVILLMRMTIPGHLVKRKSKQDDRELASGLTKDKQIADTYRAR